MLEKLQGYVGKLGCHQAAFLPDRSTTVLLLVAKRMLQEKWCGEVLIGVMPLVAEKAFERISLATLPAIGFLN